MEDREKSKDNKTKKYSCGLEVLSRAIAKKNE